jgi:hypothetical protein
MIEQLLEDGPCVVNLGLREFSDALKAQGVEVVQVDWRPPPQLDDELASLLEDLT